jgi:hypothetical protein
MKLDTIEQDVPYFLKTCVTAWRVQPKPRKQANKPLEPLTAVPHPFVYRLASSVDWRRVPFRLDTQPNLTPVVAGRPVSVDTN